MFRILLAHTRTRYVLMPTRYADRASAEWFADMLTHAGETGLRILPEAEALAIMVQQNQMPRKQRKTKKALRFRKSMGIKTSKVG